MEVIAKVTFAWSGTASDENTTQFELEFSEPK